MKRGAKQKEKEFKEKKKRSDVPGHHIELGPGGLVHGATETKKDLAVRLESNNLAGNPPRT